GAMKEDIYDNTIFHLKSIKGNNGIILHGDPGTGKSMICQAIINAALKEGYSTCFVTTRVNYAMLGEFLTTFFGRCIVIFEDIDSIGQDREHVLNSHLSDFLQFISGLYEREDGIVFIATTNYIEHLDRAITKRPVRFNRKFRIELPTDGEIGRLVALYFKDTRVEPGLCCGKKFTGAHIKEIHRTAEMLSLKRGVPIAETYGDAVRFVERNFTTQTASPGF
ncbi:MAG: ATP-binding protein, partial [Deltaproteobacteria bacterium]|nr:ATP-binding protein [Deltaproteobacteria bacterium]